MNYEDGSNTTQTLDFSYDSQLSDSDFQIWSGSVSATVTELLSLVYNATDAGINSEQDLNIAINGTGGTTPTSTCTTYTIQSTVPTATALAFQEYSYCAGTLYTSAYINVRLIPYRMEF